MVFIGAGAVGGSMVVSLTRFRTHKKGKNKKGKYGKKGNQDQQSSDNNNAEKNNSSVPSTPTTPQTASALSAALFGSLSTPEPDESSEYVRPESPEPEPVKAPMGKWAKKPEIKDTILKDDFVLPKAYRKEEPKRSRKKKYRNINEHSDVILLPGRHMCDCQVRNCQICIGHPNLGYSFLFLSR